MTDWQVQQAALDYVKRSENADAAASNALMQTAALLMIVVELRRLANRLDDARGLR